MTMSQEQNSAEEATPGVFLGDQSTIEASRVVILPVPYEGTVSYQPGTRLGPSAIIEASVHVELYDQELDSEPFRVGIHTAKPLWSDFSGPEQMVDKVSRLCRQHLQQDKFLIVLGGEHSVTAGAVRAHLEKHPDMSVLQLDAHADLRDQYHHTKWGHASVMRRIEELCPTVGVGVRSLSREEMEFARTHDLQILLAHQIHGHQDWISRAIDRLTDKVYVTIDLDVLDPGIMPAVGTPVPGGLSWHQVLTLFRQVAANKQVVGFDVVELSPIPGQVAPDFLAAKLIYKFIGYVFRERIEIES
jgi:agmatinase